MHKSVIDLSLFLVQVVFKAYTCNYIPIYQWFCYDAIECLPDYQVEEYDAQPIGSPYDAQTAICG